MTRQHYAAPGMALLSFRMLMRSPHPFLSQCPLVLRTQPNSGMPLFVQGVGRRVGLEPDKLLHQLQVNFSRKEMSPPLRHRFLPRFAAQAPLPARTPTEPTLQPPPDLLPSLDKVCFSPLCSPAAPPECPLPLGLPDYPDSSSKGHIQCHFLSETFSKEMSFHTTPTKYYVKFYFVLLLIMVGFYVSNYL